MKQRLKERDVTFLPKGGSKKKERNEEFVFIKSSPSLFLHGMMIRPSGNILIGG